MYLISPRDFSKLNRDINDEIEKVLLKFVHDGKLKITSDSEKRKKGRPRRVKIEEKEKRPRGRPRKVKTVDTKPSDGPKRKRGRPKKS